MRVGTGEEVNQRTFRVFFNRRRQWFDVYIADNSRRFMLREKCYAYYQQSRPRRSRRGLFGEVHFSLMFGEMVRNFWRRYYEWENKTRI
jgi:hypothetical protein